MIETRFGTRIRTNPHSKLPWILHAFQAHVPSLNRQVFGVVAFLILFCAGMQAQTAHFGHALSSLGSGFYQPTYAALDASGNLFVTDEGTASVYELTASSGYSTVITISQAFGIPTGIAVDASGNVYVTDQSVAGVYELLASSNYGTIIPLGSGFANPNGVALDASGDVFVADTLNNAIKEIVAVSGSIPANPTINTLAGSYNHPTSVAVDGSGNVFVADLFNSAIKEILATGGYTTVNTLGSGFSYPAGVAVDANDNVFVADSGDSSVKEILASGGYATVNTLVSGLPYSTGVVVNPAGNVFIASFSGSSVYELTLYGGVGFGSLPVATTSPETIPITFVFDTGGTIGTPTVTTLGATGLDFIDAGTGSCTVNGPTYSYNAGDSCSVAVTFAPGFSGTRFGGVTLSDSSGAPIASEYISGVGLGPQAVFSPAAGSVLDKGAVSVDALTDAAVDGAGNVYATDFVGGQVVKFAANGTASVVTTPALSGPSAVAVDGLGNLYITEETGGRVDVISPSGTASVLATPSITLSFPDGIAVDTQGTVYISDTGHARIVKVTPAGVASVVPTGSISLMNPYQVVVDGSGNLFIADPQLNQVVKLTPNGTASTVDTGSLTLANPVGVAADAAGMVYISDGGNARIVAVPPNGPAFVLGTGSAGFVFPALLSVRDGKVYVADYEEADVVEIDTTQASSLSFATTMIGNTSSDSPLLATITNNGNTPLTFEVPVSGTNPNLSSGFALSGSSTCPPPGSGPNVAPRSHSARNFSSAGLAAGASCMDAVNFTPTVPGTISGSMVITDNSLNALGPGYATQSVPLSGIATAPPVLATTTVVSTVLTLNHAAAAFLPVTGSGGYGTLTYSIAPALPAGLNFSSATGMISGIPAAVSAATTYAVTVTDTIPATASATFSLAINPAVMATVNLPAATLKQNQAASPFVPVAGSGGAGTLTYSVSPELPSGLSFSSVNGTVSGTPTAASAAATYTVTVTDSNGASASATFTLTVNSNTLITTTTTLTSSNPTPTFGTSIVLTATVMPASQDEPPGSVHFYTGSTLLGTAALNTAGVATLGITLAQGPNSVTAVYSGSTSYAGSTSGVLLLSALAGTSIGFTASPTTQLYNNPIVLTAQATSAAAGTLTGSVSFLDGTTVIATVPIGAGGMASYSATSLAQGSHSLTAAYSGDADFAPSVSTGTGIAITVGNINLDLGGDQNQTVIPGAAVNYTFPLSPLVTPTFLYNVQLTATGLPPGATYTFTPSMIPAGNGNTPVTLTVQTAKGVASLSPPASRGVQPFARSLAALAFGLILPFFGLKRIHKRLRGVPRPLAVILFSLASLWAVSALSGCGAGGFFGHTSTSGSYTITVTATSADLTRTSSVQLTIQ